MANDETGEKSEEPTGRKLSKAFEEGKAPKSQEVSSAVVLLVGGLALIALAPLGWDRLVGMFRHFVWRLSEFDPATSDFWPWILTAFREALILIIPLALLIMVAGLAVNFWQVGFILNPKAIAFKPEKLNFITGMGRFFKLRAVIDTIKNCLKLGLVFFLTYLTIKGDLALLVTMSEMEPVDIGLVTLKTALILFFKLVLLLLLLGFLDFAYQKWQFMRDMRMTKQEVKDEFKQMEGDPKVKAKIRQIQREQSKKRMLADVPKSDVVVTNPTHLAIALVYDAALAQAPLVLAKGQDLMAERIKDIAREAKVPIVENKPLAQALYKAVDVGEIIPLEFYKAVAEVLSYVYKLKGRRPGGRRR
ncbi:MAG: flagellar biosynthesis protein FlhB [Deltaproteobacteria bacterium]|nr:flagellar biosynthesis protein FlhB [Deltaproteobacteria bacterium]